MCDPITIGSLAVGAAGSLYSAHEASGTQADMVNARNAATMQELGRQQKYGAESRGIFDTSLNVFDPHTQNERLQTNQGNATNMFAANAPTNVGSITTGTAPKVVGDSENSKIASIFARGAQRGAARGKLQGYDQTTFDNNVDLGTNARKIDTISDISKVSGGVNVTEQKAAYQNAYKPPSGIGDILKFAGQVGSFAGGKGGMPNINLPGVTMPAGGFGAWY